MDIEKLRFNSRQFMVDRAFGLFPAIDGPASERRAWVHYLLDGHGIGDMLQHLKAGTRPDAVQQMLAEAPEDEATPGNLHPLATKLVVRNGNSRKTLPVRLHNRTDAVWETTPSQPLFAAYHVYSDDGEVYEFDGVRTELPRPLASNESLTFELDVICPTDPGTYWLQATLVHEGRHWLEEIGLDTGHRVVVEVHDYDVQGLTHHGRQIFERLSAMTEAGSGAV